MTQAIGISGAIAGEAVITQLSDKVPWQALLMIGGGVCALLAIIVLLAVPLDHEMLQIAADSHASSKKGKSYFKSLKDIFSNRTLLLLMLVAGILNISMDAIASVWGAPYLMYQHHFSIGISEAINSLIFIGYFVGCLIYPMFLKRFSLLGLVAFSTFMAAIFTALFAFASSSAVLLSVFASGLGFFTGAVTLVFVYVANNAPTAVLGTAFSFTEVARHVVSIVIMQLFGVLLEHSIFPSIGIYTPPFVVIVGLLIIAGCLMTGCYRTSKRAGNLEL